MEYTIEPLDNEVVLHVKGTLDGQSSDQFAESLDAAMDTAPGRLVIDLAGVDFMSSAGIGALLYAFKQLRAQQRVMELIHVAPDVRKVLVLTGVGKVLSIGESSMKVDAILKRDDDLNAQAMSNAREFLAQLFDRLDVPRNEAEEELNMIFDLCNSVEQRSLIEDELKAIIHKLKLKERLIESLRDRPKILHDRIAPYMVGVSSLLHVGADDGSVAQTFSEHFNVQLAGADPSRNLTDLPFAAFNGDVIPLEDKTVDAALLLNVLHRSADPSAVLKEVLRVTRSRVVVAEAVCLTQTHKRFSMFFDWFYALVLDQPSEQDCQYNTPKGWEWVLRDAGLRIKASVDVGLDLPAIPEYHWMYVGDVM